MLINRRLQSNPRQRCRGFDSCMAMRSCITCDTRRQADYYAVNDFIIVMCQKRDFSELPAPVPRYRSRVVLKRYWRVSITERPVEKFF